MSELTIRLRSMQTRSGQSLHDLEIAVCDEADRLFRALRRLQNVALDYFPADGEAFNAMQEATAALEQAGEPNAKAANREARRLGLPT